MRDDSKNWPIAAPLSDPITTPEIRVEQITLSRQTLVSGTAGLSHFNATLGPAIGWPEVALGPSYAVALRRDRVLLIDGPVLADGWHDDGDLAVSDMTSGYAVFELTGSALMRVLQHGTEITRDLPSASAARSFAGFPVIIYHFGTIDAARIHVPAAHTTAFQQITRQIVQAL